MRHLGAERLDRVDRVGRSVAVDFDPRGLEPLDAVDRGGDHLEAGLGRRELAAPFHPRIAGDDDQDALEPELIASRGRGREMRDVHGIERAAEDAEALHRASVREGLVNAVLREPRAD
ncbi:MAG: hypothetical protein QOI08_1716 [Actinomycetota bacterium]|nr:hypothetical protein [Actinomycetota bacterium]